MSRSKNMCGAAHGCVGLGIYNFCVSMVLCSGISAVILSALVPPLLSRAYTYNLFCVE
ncbi:unnamed protein product [Ectocarpus sp. CCAP 1310/34]|nr:unnamed protein product [Ectocarpus sp. CCAP 1310/34]